PRRALARSAAVGCRRGFASRRGRSEARRSDRRRFGPTPETREFGAGVQGHAEKREGPGLSPGPRALACSRSVSVDARGHDTAAGTGRERPGHETAAAVREVKHGRGFYQVTEDASTKKTFFPAECSELRRRSAPRAPCRAACSA